MAFKVLIVDDDPAIRNTLADLLAVEGYVTETAFDGQDALNKASELRPDIVLLDMIMPILDGWGFARESRARGDTYKLVVMTASHNARDAANDIQADSYLAKPFNLDDLIGDLQRLCPPRAV